MFKMFPLIHILYLPYLLILSLHDIRTRSVSLSMLATGICIDLLLLARPGVFLLRNVCAGLIPGAFLLILSLVLHGALGLGDVFVILLLGAVTGFWQILLILFFSFLCAFLYCVPYLLMKKYTRRSTFPFLPFLTIGYIGGAFFALL